MRALQAAKHACEVSGWAITNLQLQKILYIAHMIHMGRTGQPLIDDEYFEAWDYGPVLPSVYRHVSGFGSHPIGNIFAAVADAGQADEVASIESAVAKLANIEPFRLVKVLHDDKSAWKEYYDQYNRGHIIPDEAVVQEYGRRFPQGD